jgi:DNA-binding transcriptional ArsR family regulator
LKKTMPVVDQNHYTRAEELLPQLTQLYKAKTSTNALAKQFGLRREAVSTVLMAAGVMPSTPGRDRLLAYVEENPGLSVEDLARELDMPKSTVSRYLRGTPQHKMVITRKKSDYTTYSDEQKIAALKEAWQMLTPEQQEKGLSRSKYDELVGHRADRASSVTYVRRYGSWSVACEAAGIKASAARRSNYEREFEDADVVEGVRQFIEETGKTAFHEYAKWAKTSGTASGPLVIVRLGSWTEARRRALELDPSER